MNRRHVGMTVGQIVLGGIVGFLAAVVSLLFIERILWGAILASLLRGSWFVYVWQLLSFLAVYGSAVVCVGEVVRWLARDPEISRRNVYQGAFLGTAGAVALMLMAAVDWSSIDPRLFPSPIILELVRIVVVVISLPVKILLLLHVPPELLLTIGAPIGAILAYRLAESEDSDQSPAAS